MARTKITEGSPILTAGEAYRLVDNLVDEMVDDTKHFKKYIKILIDDIVINKNYYNEAGINALGKLLKKKVVIEVSISSERDKRRKYRCVKFKNGSMACTCTNFITYQNVLRPHGLCKHLKTLKEKGTF